MDLRRIARTTRTHIEVTTPYMKVMSGVAIKCLKLVVDERLARQGRVGVRDRESAHAKATKVAILSESHA
jgi:hypothetical protein